MARKPKKYTAKEIAQLEEKVKVYEQLLHDIQMYAEVVMDHDKVSRLIQNICGWSYAHRRGNGENSEEEQERIVRFAFERLRNIQQGDKK